MSRKAKRHPQAFKPKLIALSVAACFGLSTQAQANPTGGTVVAGSANFATAGNTLTVTNSANAIINWQSFSIGVNEITQFLQSSAASAVLNHVVGANGVIPQSVIDGILSSNGRVFLMNQSGIVIGSTGRVDVAGFVASSLNLSDQDFLNGRLRFTETPGAGAVSNAGIISTPSGGSVFLVAPNVSNSGIIRSPQGQIVLAAGKSVELVSERSPFVTVNLTADNEQAVNVGQLVADSGQIGMFGALVRQGGVIEANSAVAGANGEIRLVATHDLVLEAGSRTTANGVSGGNVVLQAESGTNAIYGTVEATGSAGQGGTIQALGVRVGVLGYGVIDASGETGGGTVLIGGDAHGANPGVQNAQQVLIGSDGVIRADAGATGDGGRVIVWSDAGTQAYGSISAQGGSQSGDGGFVETSSAGGMDLNGIRVDTRAAHGQWGTWLLDPTNVSIVAASGNSQVVDVDQFTDQPGVSATIDAATIESNFLTVGNTQIQATNNVDFQTDLSLTFNGPRATFSVRAGNDIDLASHTISTNGHNVILSANDTMNVGNQAPDFFELNTVSGTGSIIGGGNISTVAGGAAGGSITLSGFGVNVGALTTHGLDLRAVPAGGAVAIAALGGGVQTGNISTNGANGVDFDPAGQQTPPTAGSSGGSITISSQNGSIATGTIDASGGNGGNGGYASGIQQVFGGAAGGAGGIVTIGNTTTTSVTTGAITANGGAGGYGGSGATMAAQDPLLFPVGLGGAGGSGGIVSLASAGNVTTGAVTLSGGTGGAGGSNNIGTLDGLPNGTDINVTLEVGGGGVGGNGGSLTISNSGNISTGLIAALGGAGGAGGSGNSATTSNVTVTTGLTSANGSAGAGVGGAGGGGGSIDFSTTGSVSVGGTITTSGGAGGVGGDSASATSNMNGDAPSVNASASAGVGGAGGGLGFVFIQTGAASPITTGAITMVGGAGGAGGANAVASALGSSSLVTAAPFILVAANAGAGGSGGSFGSLFMTGGDISVGTISANGGQGGTGGIEASAQAQGTGSGSIFTTLSQGDGGRGGNGASIFITGNTIGTGAIDTHGGNGGKGGTTTATGGIGGKGGDGAEGGSITLTAPVSVTVSGTINANAGAGGDGGTSASGNGGAGGNGGDNAFVSVSIDPDTASVGSVSVAGGAGGNGGDGGLQGGNGGAGGSGGDVGVSSQTLGTLSVGDIDVSGANGGAGGASGGTGLDGGAGGDGGLGGVAFVDGGSITITGSFILANGGAGGAGGAASAGLGGIGGSGGGGGLVELLASTATGPGTISAPANFSADVKGGPAGSSTSTTGQIGPDGAIIISGDLIGSPGPGPTPGPGLPPESGGDSDISAPLISSINKLTDEVEIAVPDTEEVEKKDKQNREKQRLAVCK